MNLRIAFVLSLSFISCSSVAQLAAADEESSYILQAPPISSAGKLFVETNGVALSKFPSQRRLSASVLIRVLGRRTAVPWTATSNAAWLTVTPSGVTGQMLVLTAKPGKLKQDTTHIATVTVSSSELAPNSATASIRVALWSSATDPVTVTKAHQAFALATNPVESWVYVSAGGSRIAVFNVYSGALLTAFNKVAPTVGQLVVSPNGRQLFAVDTTNYKIIELDAATGVEIRTFPLAGPIAADFNFAYARPDAVATLFAPGQPAIDVATGAAVSAPITNGPIGFYDPFIRATPDGSKLVILERGLSPGSLYLYSVSGPRNQLSVVQQKGASIVGENCQALALSDDGSMIYPACGAPYEFDVYDGDTLTQVQTLPAVPYPDNAVIDSNGDFVGGVNGIYEQDDVFVYNVAGYSLGAVPTTTYSYSAGQGSNQLAVSGDSARVISATGYVYDANQTLMFRNLP